MKRRECSSNLENFRATSCGGTYMKDFAITARKSGRIISSAPSLFY
jgi:hypothetical protein